jgi:hypothetical protein
MSFTPQFLPQGIPCKWAARGGFGPDPPTSSVGRKMLAADEIEAIDNRLPALTFSPIDDLSGLRPAGTVGTHKHRHPPAPCERVCCYAKLHVKSVSVSVSDMAMCWGGVWRVACGVWRVACGVVSSLFYSEGKEILSGIHMSGWRHCYIHHTSILPPLILSGIHMAGTHACAVGDLVCIHRG